ncbi:hypothetical protein I302_100668 [Kwoniella bestiolae CBS 10118]|uniref:Major facilitator superfamily (MFS) profile domain-containing protein n=1 Tax=Kwoniella bestiolae CBS 10118 TaxID=1296100 RepID=A0AAJ8K0T1_9TREE
MDKRPTRPSILSRRSIHRLSELRSQGYRPPIPPGESPRHDGISRGSHRVYIHEKRDGKNERDNVDSQSRSVLDFLKRDMALPSNRLRRAMLAVLFLVMFLARWNDASQGPLLPSLQTYYSPDYRTHEADLKSAFSVSVVSTIWLANFAGFMIAGLSNVYISDTFGFGIAAPFGAVMQGLAYTLICWGSPFPLFVIAYIFNGFGLGLQNAQVNSLVTRLKGSPTKMFLMHAMYGVGATVSPFVSTLFVQRLPNRVYYYFAVSLGLALMTALSLIAVFQARTEDQVVGRRQREIRVKDGTPCKVDPSQKENEASGGKMKEILKMPVIHCMAFFMLIYGGIEVSVGGWATSFLTDERGGNDNSGYVTAGYFGGLTVGRIVLIPVTKRIGNHMSIYLYSLCTLLLTIIIWFTHSFIGNAVCFSLVGVFLGPMFPIVMNVVAEIIPGELQAGAIGWIASLAHAGTAIMPFIVGVIAEKYGIWILQSVALALTIADILLWFLVTGAWHNYAPSTQRHQLDSGASGSFVDLTDEENGESPMRSEVTLVQDTNGHEKFRSQGK